jgi:anti-sigma factor RsiW
MNTDPGPVSHLESTEVAGYLDRTLPAADRARVEAHLSECRDCRAELIAVTRVLRGRERPRRVLLPLAAAAAVLVLVVPWSRLTQIRQPGQPVLREPASTTAVAPTVIAPRGPAGGTRFVWSAVSGADRYRITVFTRDGSVAWETQLAETTVALPETLATPLAPGARYFWKVEARVGWQRWVSSELTEFSVPPHGK